MNHVWLAFTPIVFCAFIATPPQNSAYADSWKSYSLQSMAFAPNAGGQLIYTARREDNNREWTLFANDYLRAGNAPLIGITYGWRFPLVSRGYPLRPYVQFSTGASSGGPILEALWGMNILYVLRIDFATQLFLTFDRVVTWSNPLWVGITIPLP